jgi:hypothetical protein
MGAIFTWNIRSSAPRTTAAVPYPARHPHVLCINCGSCCAHLFQQPAGTPLLHLKVTGWAVTLRPPIGWSLTGGGSPVCQPAIVDSRRIRHSGPVSAKCPRSISHSSSRFTRREVLLPRDARRGRRSVERPDDRAHRGDRVVEEAWRRVRHRSIVGVRGASSPRISDRYAITSVVELRAIYTADAGGSPTFPMRGHRRRDRRCPERGGE